MSGKQMIFNRSIPSILHALFEIQISLGILCFIWQPMKAFPWGKEHCKCSEWRFLNNTHEASDEINTKVPHENNKEKKNKNICVSIGWITFVKYMII